MTEIQHYGLDSVIKMTDAARIHNIIKLIHDFKLVSFTTDKE